MADRIGSFSIDGWGTVAGGAYAPASLQQNRHRWPHAVRMDFAPPDADTRQSARHSHCAAERCLPAERDVLLSSRTTRAVVFLNPDYLVTKLSIRQFHKAVPACGPLNVATRELCRKGP